MIHITTRGVLLQIEEREGEGLPHGRTLAPGRIVNGEWADTDLTNEPWQVQSAAEQAWNEAAVAQYREAMEAEAAEIEERLANAPLPSISDRQFFQALAVAGIISQDEALAAVRTGDIPAVMQAVIDAMPDEQRFATTMLISGATTFEFANPLVGLFAQGQGMDVQTTRAFWQGAASL